jgi:uncharacterized membrane protein YhaH (DUF805 family)
MNAAMTPVDWAKRPILEKYADFTGRAPRAEFWWFVLGLVIVAIVLRIIESILGIGHMFLYTYGPLTLLFRLATIVPGLAVGVRRLHDTGRTGWWVVLPIIPLCIAVFFGGTAMLGAAAGSGMGMMAGAGIAALFMFVAGIAALVLLFFYIQPSQPGSNQYGPNPYGESGTGPVPAE